MATFRKPKISNMDHVVDLPTTAVPDGFRWALLPEESSSVDRRRGEILKFDDPKSQKIKEFKYQPLSNMKKRIRLLELMAGKQETSEVECQLFEGEIRQGKIWRTLDDKDQTEIVVKYEALSWSWGAGAPEYQVLIRKGRKRRRKQASKDLVWALRYLRYPDKDRILWIDAICIDQKNVEEKNHQVQMMSQIYSYCDRVCIWLGLDDRDSSMAINFINNEILQLEHFDSLCTDENNAEKWQSLLILMQRQWFFRRWVVQEIALAKDAMIYCGPDQISWKDFSVAVELFVEVETATHRLSEVMKKDPRFYHVPGWFEFVSALGASLLVEATGMIFRYYKPEKKETSKLLLASAAPSGGDDKQTPDQLKNGLGVNGSTGSAANGNTQDAMEDETDGVGSEIDENETDSTNSEDGVESERDEETDSEKDERNKTNANGLNQNKSGKSVETSPKSPPAKASDEGISDDPISNRRPLLSLEYLVSKLSIFEATEPRDAIYALLAIANDGYPYAEGQDDQLSQTAQEILSDQSEQKPFHVNYGRPYADVCQYFIEFCIARSNKSRALDIICRPWAPDPKPGNSIHFTQKPKSDGMKEWLEKIQENHNKTLQDFGLRAKNWKLITKYFPESKDRTKASRLPSWIPRLDGAPFAMFPHAGMHIMKMGRKNADPLVGLPQILRNYNSAQGMEVDAESLRFRKRRWQNAHCMFVEGFILETVEKTADSSQSGSIPKEWLELGKWKIRKDQNEDKEGPPEDFWRTLVADRGNNGHNPPYYYSRACKESVYKGGLASGSVNTSDLINNERNSIVAQFCRRVQSVIWNRSLIKTDKGELGIANKAVKKGDLVCILYGCSVPVILRRKMKSSEIIKKEEEEDRLFERAESILRRYMSTAKAIKLRKKKWEALPDHGTEEELGKGKWSKEMVREWLRKYKSLASNHEEKKSKPVNNQRQAKKRADCYYKFLGECYVHGMMDGEAMRRKTKYEIEMAESWAEKRKAGRDGAEKLGKTQEQDRDGPSGNDGHEAQVSIGDPEKGKGSTESGRGAGTGVDGPSTGGNLGHLAVDHHEETAPVVALGPENSNDQHQNTQAVEQGNNVGQTMAATGNTTGPPVIPSTDISSSNTPQVSIVGSQNAPELQTRSTNAQEHTPSDAANTARPSSSSEQSGHHTAKETTTNTWFTRSESTIPAWFIINKNNFSTPDQPDIDRNGGPALLTCSITPKLEQDNRRSQMRIVWEAPRQRNDKKQNPFDVPKHKLSMTFKLEDINDLKVVDAVKYPGGISNGFGYSTERNHQEYLNPNGKAVIEFSTKKVDVWGLDIPQLENKSCEVKFELISKEIQETQKKKEKGNFEFFGVTDFSEPRQSIWTELEKKIKDAKKERDDQRDWDEFRGEVLRDTVFELR